MPLANDLTTFFDKNQARARDELFDLLRIPSVSARSEHNADTARAAEWVAESLRGDRPERQRSTRPRDIRSSSANGAARRARRRCSSTGTTTCSRSSRSSCGTARRSSRRFATARSSRAARWTTKASSSCTSKRSRRTSRRAARCRSTSSSSPKGEEEVGSDHLAEFIEAHNGELACDAVVISDSAMFAPGLPSILSSLRGLAYFQIDVPGRRTRSPLRQLRRRA